MSQQRHLFKEKNAAEKWHILPDKSGQYKEEKCENCHCIRMSIRYNKDPFEIFYRFKREEGHEYSGTVLKCGDGYKRNRDRSSSEHGKPIFIPKLPVKFKEEVIQENVEMDYEGAETIADLRKNMFVDAFNKQDEKMIEEKDAGKIEITFDEIVADLIKHADDPKRQAERYQKFAHVGSGSAIGEFTPQVTTPNALYRNGDFVSEEQARLDECLILIKLLYDHIEERGLQGFSKELRIAARILKLNKITV